jgi:hypothetical protein
VKPEQAKHAKQYEHKGDVLFKEMMTRAHKSNQRTYTGADIEWRTQTRESVLRKLAANCTRLCEQEKCRRNREKRRM